VRNILHQFKKFAFILVLLGLTAQSWGQNATSMTLSNLLDAADTAVGNKQFVEARPYLTELVSRFEGSEQKDNLESVYFYLAVSYLVEYSDTNSKDALTEAIKWLQRMQKEFPQGKFAIKGYLFEADAYRGLQDFLAAADIYEKMLKPPLEPLMNYEQRLEALEKLTQALYIKREWKRGLPYFEIFLKETRNPDHQAMAAAALLEGNIKEGHFDKALEFLRFLVGDSPARYNLQLNVALMDAGDRLGKEKRYTEAMLMYRMVLTVEEITKWQEERLTDLEGQLSRLRVTTQDKNNERAIELETDIFNTKAQIKALNDFSSYTQLLKVRIARNYLQTSRDFESFFAYMNLINEFPDSESMENYIYAAFTGATRINKPDSVVELGERYLEGSDFVEYRDDVIVKLLEYYKNRGEFFDFFELSKEFVDKSPDKDYAKQVVFLMGDAYTRRGDYNEMIRQFKSWDEKYPTTPMTPGLYYWIGMGHLLQAQYIDSWEYYNKILLDYPGSTYAEDSLYRRGISAMGSDDMKSARRDFNEYIRQYPETSQRGEVEFFLGEVDSAEGNVQSAIEHYSNVEKYSDSIQFIQNAYFRMGALLEANQQYDEMAEVYKQFIEKYADRGELTAAIFQLGRAHEKNSQPHLMLQEYLIAIEEYGDDPYTYGLDKILNAYPQRYYQNLDRINQNLELLTKLNENAQYRELIEKDRGAIFTFLGKNPLIEEQIKRSLYDAQFRERLVATQEDIQPWLKQFQQLKADYPTETPEQSFKRLYDQARENGEETLALRLQHALDMLGVQADASRVFTAEDFDYASPVTLVWLGKKIGEFDQDTAREGFEMVITDHPSSEYVFDAQLALGDIDMQAGNFQEALQRYTAAESDFPRHERAAIAVMKQGDALRKIGDFSSARQKYNQVATNREWRGPIQAEALYKIGESFAEEGDNDHAVAAFQNVYIGFAAYVNWAAKAYLETGRILIEMGKLAEAREVWDEFLESEMYRDTEEYLIIQQARRGIQ